MTQHHQIVMKLVIKILTGLTALFIGVASAQAAQNGNEIEATKIVQPRVREQEVGKTVTVKVAIDETGKPHNVGAVDVDIYDHLLADRVVKSVYDWEFTPGVDQFGRAVTVTVKFAIVITGMESA